MPAGESIGDLPAHFDPPAANVQVHNRVFQEVSMRDFDPLYYLASNRDVLDTVGMDQRAAVKHFVKHGVHEMRSPNIFFDPVFYKSIHPDLVNHNGASLLLHWYQHGITEGRQGSPWFSIKFYLQSHPDLVATFGSDFAAAFEHYKHDGHKERRNTVPGKTLTLFWGDVINPNGSRQLADNSGECLPEKPVQEEPSTGKILGLLCNAIGPAFLARAGCKWAVGKVVKEVDGEFVICDPNGGNEVHVRPDPIFRGDMEVPDDIGAIA